MMFYAWLQKQTDRKDDVGLFARYAMRDKVFPRTRNQLFYFLHRYEGMPEQRRCVKQAHAEWRKVRDGAA
jgi:hypothetical protein